MGLCLWDVHTNALALSCTPFSSHLHPRSQSVNHTLSPQLLTLSCSTQSLLVLFLSYSVFPSYLSLSISLNTPQYRCFPFSPLTHSLFLQLFLHPSPPLTHSLPLSITSAQTLPLSTCTLCSDSSMSFVSIPHYQKFYASENANKI